MQRSGHARRLAKGPDVGRSVSVPSGALYVDYQICPPPQHWCSECDTYSEDKAHRGALPGEDGFEPDDDADYQQDVCCCAACGAHEDNVPLDDEQEGWAFATEMLQGRLAERFKSVGEDDGWLGQEDRVLSSNRYASFGVSEYCGMAAVWCVPKDLDYRDESRLGGLQAGWLSSIEKGFFKAVGGVFGESVSKVGTFSDGTSIYQRER